MMKTSLAQLMKFAKSEADIKNYFQDYFQIENTHIGWVDLIAPHIFFEVKQGDYDIFAMLAQVILTIHKHQKELEFLPEYIGGFDSYKCGIIEFDELYQRIETYSDINWNQIPSAVDDKTIAVVKKFANEIGGLKVYEFAGDEKELKSVIGKIISGKAPDGRALQKRINFGNYVSVFMKYAAELGDNIDIPDGAVKEGIGLTDFYLADLLSEGDQPIEELSELKVLRYGPTYRSNQKMHGRIFIEVFMIKDIEKHNRFWEKYKRPPKREYWGKIIQRRDLLVPREVRERKGAFFTPKQWVAKATEYMAEVFGDDFVNMYVWDLAAGTGNLLQYLPQDKRNIFASTLDAPDVEIMRQTGVTLENNIFQFDFLNDVLHPHGGALGKLPKRLQDIINDPDEIKKLVVFINPPYAEARSGLHKNSKENVKDTAASKKYKAMMGNASNELFAQFLMRIYMEMRNSRLAEFSTLKILQAGNFADFRNVFRAKLEKMFIVPADTFDNVTGQFPIGFKIWDTGTDEKFNSVMTDIYDKDGEFIGRKKLSANEKIQRMNQWISSFPNNDKNTAIGFLDCSSPDFQNQNYVFIDNIENDKNDHRFHLYINENNLDVAAIYLAVRHAIDPTWLNDRDQFLYPSIDTLPKMPVLNVPDNRLRSMVASPSLFQSREEFLYDMDFQFKHNCLIYTLFHSQNRISGNTPPPQAGWHTSAALLTNGAAHKSCLIPDCGESGHAEALHRRAERGNHWIPFTEQQVKSKSAFDSNFMSRYLKERGIPDILTPAARKVYDAGLELWRYYFKHINTNASINTQNASFYDIKEYFKGRKPDGKMNLKSDDAEFNRLESELSAAVKELGKEIEPKIYEYGWLK